MRKESVMTDAPVEPEVKRAPTAEPRATASRHPRPICRFGEPVSIKANVVAAIGSFLILIVAPTIVLNFVPVPDDLVPLFTQFVPMGLAELATTALGIALVFLVIGISYQVWQSHSGLSSWWPLVLAFPVTLILFAPDALAHGGPLRAWFALALALGVAFCVHWLAVLAFGELID
jgi:hypothetical protein